MTRKKAQSSPPLGVVEPLCQVAAYNGKLLVLLMDAADAGRWNGGVGDSDRSCAVANGDGFVLEHAGWVSLDDVESSERRALVVSLDDSAGTLEIYHLGGQRLGLFGPGHTRLQADADCPSDARERIFARLAAGPSSDAKVAGQLTIQNDLMIVEHNLDTSDLAPKTLRLGHDAPFKVLDDSGSALVQLARDTYSVLIEPAALPWRENSSDRIAFVVPASDKHSPGSRPRRR